jgi:hypothetical protein
VAAGGAAALHVGVGGVFDVAVRRGFAIGSAVRAVSMRPTVLERASSSTAAATTAVASTTIVVATPLLRPRDCFFCPVGFVVWRQSLPVLSFGQASVGSAGRSSPCQVAVAAFVARQGFPP